MIGKLVLMLEIDGQAKPLELRAIEGIDHQMTFVKFGTSRLNSQNEFGACVGGSIESSWGEVLTAHL